MELTMNVFELPFTKFIGLALSEKDEFLLMLKDQTEYLNHLGTVHASAQFSLAEATSGYFLLNEFHNLTNIVPVVRKVETKYKKPVQGAVFSRACFIETDRVKIIETLESKKRVLLTVRVSLFDSEEKNVMQSDFEWFIVKSD